jgi:hypothetical protein
MKNKSNTIYKCTATFRTHCTTRLEEEPMDSSYVFFIYQGVEKMEIT